MPQLSYTLRPLPFTKESRALGALVAVGMRIRIGSKQRSDLEQWMQNPTMEDAAVDAFWADAENEGLAEASLVSTWLDGEDRAQAAAMLVRRDRLESALVAIGAAALAGSVRAATLEKALGHALERIDDHARRLPELPDRVRGSDISELRRSAALDGSSWWLDEAAVAPISKGGDLLRALRERRKSVSAQAIDTSLRMTASRLQKSAAAGAFLYAEVAGQEDEALSHLGTALVARLCDDAVDVVGMGLGDEDVPPGLLVHAADGKIEGLVAVEISPPLPKPPTKAKTSFWVPLAGAEKGTYVLQVTHERGGVRTKGELVFVVE